jgi:hypothetical protein
MAVTCSWVRDMSLLTLSAMLVEGCARSRHEPPARSWVAAATQPADPAEAATPAPAAPPAPTPSPAPPVGLPTGSLIPSEPPAEVAAIRQNSERLAAEALARFPIRVNKGGRLDIGGRKRAFFCTADVTISKSGRVDVLQVIETKEAAAGFTGYTMLRFTDQAGNVVYVARGPSEGTSGTAVPFSSPSRITTPFSFQLPKAALFLCHGVEVIPMHEGQQPDRQITENLTRVRKFAEDNKANWVYIAKALAAGG